MLKLKERYVVDEHGKKKAVVLDMEAYRQLMEHLENLEDALELDQAVRESKEFRSYDEIRSEVYVTGWGLRSKVFGLSSRSSEE